MKQLLITLCFGSLVLAGCSSSDKSSNQQTTAKDTTMASNTTQETPKYPGTPTTTKPTTTGSGLSYIDMVEGTGASPQPGNSVTVDYTGYFLDGSIFDSSVKAGRPYTFSIGRHRVIAGWDEGIMTMKIGGKRKLIVPPELGYGSQGYPGAIPPNSTLVFDVTLISIQ
ncbi:MAG TPA: FKBP-type peptidyl-prolyl cis-trans isomerase [Bacteroidota bacterium]|nr:FKBP-type peptidyl-prolyl cis-trans isomerase [Bacteroidota bacterium]